MDGDRIWDESIALGMRNRDTVELARRHCLDMQFVPSGGHGMAEEATGLPIDMRQIQCPVAIDNSMSPNLWWTATSFYNDHCRTCGQRRSTGEIPNLATAVAAAGEQAEAAQARTRRELDIERATWSRRVEERRAVAATAGEAMAGVLRDIDVLDSDPADPASEHAREAARNRLSALADRAPEVFAERVVNLGCSLVTDASRAYELLDAFRRLARHRPEFAEAAVTAAVAALRAGAPTWAGPCIAEHSDHLDPGGIDASVCASLIMLAGAPEEDHLGRMRFARANDPTGLYALAQLAPAAVDQQLRAMLPPPPSAVRIVLPVTVPPPAAISAAERAAAAESICLLASAAPDLAAGLVQALILSLGVPPEDSFNDVATPAAQKALATLIVLDVGDTASTIESTGQHAGSDLRERLMGVYSQASDLIETNPDHGEPGSPAPDPQRKRAVTRLLLSAAAARVQGDWGDNLRFEGAQLIETLTQADPALAMDSLSTVLGLILHLLSAQEAPAPPRLHTTSNEDALLQGLEQVSRGQSIASAVDRLLNAAEVAAKADPVVVCHTIADLLTDERDHERSTDLLWTMLPSLGRIGRAHGSQPRVLAHILPLLHSNLVSSEPGLRARALEAWTTIAAEHELPASLNDLIPILLRDPAVIVARALAKAASTLDWPEPDRLPLLRRAFDLMHGVDASTFDGARAAKDGIRAALRLSRYFDDGMRALAEFNALHVANELDGYDLRDVLRAKWLPRINRTPEMAALRLRQARDPRINDRLTGRGVTAMSDLLTCGQGLASLPERDLIEAALESAPQYPLVSARYAEVAWRSGRPDTAAAIMHAVLDATPNQPAYRTQRHAVGVLLAVLETESAAADPTADWRQAAARAAAAAEPDNDEESGFLHELANAARTVTHLRTALAEAASPEPGDPAAVVTSRADAIVKAADQLQALATSSTDTCSYLRAVASASHVAAHFLRADAAVLNADVGTREAHLEAARRRAELIRTELDETFAPDDPLAAPLRTQLDEAVTHSPRGTAAKHVSRWSTLSLPIPLITGNRRSGQTMSRPELPPPPPEQAPVAVVLASLDTKLITGPEVLQPHHIYNLSVDVQTDPWPDWAERLDIEFLSHLTGAELTLPSFSWSAAAYRAAGHRLRQAGSLVLRFGLGPGMPAPPILVRATWRGTVEGTTRRQKLDVTGHRELRLRPFDASRDAVTDYPVFDERLLGLYDRLAREGYDPAQLQAFCRLMTATCRAGLRMTWDRRYRRGSRVTERQFHDDLMAALLDDSDLQGRLERGSPAALGYLDIRHDGITAELKVERRTPVTEDNVTKYMGQPTQYAAADGARLSILTILDMSPKLLPIGTPENYLFTLVPHLHGLTNPEAPSLVAVMIVNANLPTPSSWSRRKPPQV